MQRHLIIFARAPRLGRVKRRLATGIGDVAALRFHCATLAGLIRRVGHDRRWHCRLAITPDSDKHGSGLRIMSQGPGDLGARMTRIPRRLPPGLVVIIGSDIPDITAAHIARAFTLLASHDAVFGPADDGGYWLAGLRNRRLPYPLFRHVRWSTADALADTLAELPRHWRIARADRLHDIDDARAYAEWRGRQK